MHTPLTQRWRRRRSTYRPAGEVIQPRRYDVAAIPDDITAKSFVIQHHYSGSYPAARFRFGLYCRDELQGVAVFSHPCNNKVLSNVFATPVSQCVELGRFVLLDDVPGNGESWFLGRCFHLLRNGGIAGVISFADPVARCAADGTTIFGGHIGTIYQAHNAVYLGTSTPRSLRLLPDGSVLNDRAIQKLLARERGWRYVARRLMEFGADAPNADVRQWAQHWVARLTRRLRHRGNHKYAWGLLPVTRRLLGTGLAYPKFNSTTLTKEV